MKTLKDYVAESQQWIENPAVGDDFAINIKEDTLIESYIVDVKDDAIVIQGDDQVFALLEAHGCTMEDDCTECGYPMEECVCETNGMGAMEEDALEGIPDTMGAVQEERRDVDPILYKALKRMSGPSWLEAETALATQFGLLKKSSDPGLFRDYTQQLVDLYKQQGVQEGHMKDIDIERQDYEKMSPLAFRNRYHKSKEEWYDQHKSLLEPKKQQDRSHWDFGRMMELAGIGFKPMVEDPTESEPSMMTSPTPDGTAEDDPVGVDEAEYQGRKVSLGKPFLTPDGPKKRSVYVRNPKGNVVKVNFGDKKLRIKKSNPARRKSFRARHRCENPGPRHKARFWSCKMW